MSAREAALTVLHAWFGPAIAEQGSSLQLTPFQQEAAARIGTVLTERKGALLADAVGLGKTWVALAVIESALRAGEQVLLVIPSALRRHWQQHLRELPRELRNKPRLYTQTALSLGRLPPRQPGLVVVDEAHAFRNPRTRRYESLARLTREARTLLLTATPINNALADLYHLIRLFARDNSFADLSVPDLKQVFLRGEQDPLAHKAVERVIDAVVVRRTRDHVATSSELRFARRAPPQSLRYDLVAAYGPAWADTYRAIQQLGFACVAPALNGNGSELMRLQLLKRMESSTSAFATSLQRIAQLNQLLYDVLEKGRWIEPAALRSLVQDGEVGTQLPLEEVLVTQLPREVDAGALRAALRADQVLLDRALCALRSTTTAPDPKLEALQRVLRELGPGVLVFTQYRDTAVYLWQRLLRHFRTGLVHGSEARLGRQRAARSTVIECFAPAANGARKPSARTRVDVLIATDVLSEGLNLQDAHTVVSYDLPWNPVTLMQRMGRVDRLGSPHEMVRLCNFLPDRGLEEWLGLLERVERKLHVIERTVGADGALLDAEPEPRARNMLIARNSLHDTAQNTRAFTTHEQIEALRARWRRHTTFAPGKLPVYATIAGSEAGWLFAVGVGARTRLLLVDARGRAREDDLLAARLLTSALETRTEAVHNLPPPPWSAVTTWLEAERAARPFASNKSAPESAAASLLLRALNHQSAGSALLQRAGRLLQRLESPLEPEASARLRQSLELLNGHDAADCLVVHFETALGSARSGAVRNPQIRPLAALRIEPEWAL